MEKTGNITVLEAKSRFKKVDVSIIENENIDCLTLGIYTKLIVLGMKWNLNVRGLRKHLGLSDEKVRKSLSLLEHEGYIVRTPCRNDKGQLLGWNYAIYPIPVDEYNRSQAGRETKKQPTEEPSTPETEYPENRPLGSPTTRQAEYTETGGDINNRLNVSYILNESFKKDKDKSLSQKGSEQGCGTSLPPSVAPQHLSAASSGVSSPCSSDDAFAPLTFEEEEATNKGATACGVNVNPLQTPLPPFFSSDADAEPSGEMDAKPTSKSKARAKSKPADTTDYDAIVEFWNKTNPNLRQVRNLNNKRKKQIRKLISENDATIDDVFNAMRAISVSSFCNGSHNWRADFDWFIADTKSCFNRLLEGAFFSSPEERSEYARIATGTNANFEPKLPNGWDRERYDMYIRNGFEITEDGKLYKNGKLYK